PGGQHQPGQRPQPPAADLGRPARPQKPGGHPADEHDRDRVRRHRPGQRDLGAGRGVRPADRGEQRQHGEDRPAAQPGPVAAPRPAPAAARPRAPPRPAPPPPGGGPTAPPPAPPASSSPPPTPAPPPPAGHPAGPGTADAPAPARRYRPVTAGCTRKIPNAS